MGPLTMKAPVLMSEHSRQKAGSSTWKARLEISQSFTSKVPSVYKLPDDILQYIFLFTDIDGNCDAVDEDEESVDGDGDSMDVDDESMGVDDDSIGVDDDSMDVEADPMDGNDDAVNSIMSSSQVCRRWRAAALQNRMVWLRFIDWIYSPLAWIEELLRRSHPCPFDFGDFHRGETIDLAARFRKGRRDGDVLALVLAHSTRLRSFCVETTSSGIDSVVSPLFSSLVPSLEYLGLCIDVDDGGVVPDILSFDPHPPRLHHLLLGQLSVNIIPMPILRSLVTLSVTDIYEDNLASYTVPTWLGILADMPALKHLAIHNAIVMDAFTPSEDLFMVYLGHLERLVIDGPFHETVTLISYLSLPPRSSFDLTMWFPAIPGSDERKLATFLKHNLSSWEKDPSFRGFVAHCTAGCTEFTNKYMTSKEGDPLFRIQLSPRTHDTPSLFLSLFPVFSSIFPTTKTLIMSININGSDLRDPFLRLIRDYFHLFATLRTFKVQFGAGKLLLPLVQLVSSSSDEPPSHNCGMLFPELKTVQVSAMQDLPLVDAYVAWRTEQGFPVEVSSH